MRASRLAMVIVALTISAPAVAQEQFGAVAIDEATGATGYAVNQASQAAAEQAAVQDCGSAGCVAAVWFSNACGAVALGSGGYGAGWAENRDGASVYAIDACERYASGCTVRQVVCTGP